MTHTFWLDILVESRKELQKAIVRWGSDSSLIAICELALNILHDRVPAVEGIQKSNKTHLYYLKKLADRKVSLNRKRAFLLKKEGQRFLTSLLANRPCIKTSEDISAQQCNEQQDSESHGPGKANASG